MTRGIASIALSLLLAGTCLPRAGSAADETAIDLYARLPAIEDIAVAPDGRHIALACDRAGRRAACVYEFDAIDKPPAYFGTRDDQRLTRIRWAGPEWLLLDVNVTEDLTNVTNNVRLMSFARTFAIDTRTRAATQLLKNAGAAYAQNLTRVVAMNPATPDEIWMAATYSACNGCFGLFRVDLRTGIGKLENDGTNATYAYLVDGQGVLRARADYDWRQRRDLIYRVDTGHLTKIFDQATPGLTANSVGGLVRGTGTVAIGNYNEAGYYVPWLLDLATSQVRQADVSLRDTDIDDWIPDGTSSSIVGFVYATGDRRQEFFDPQLEHWRKTLASALPGKSVWFHSWSRDRSVIGLSAAGPGEPAMFYIFDAGRKALSPVGPARPELTDRPVATTHAVRFAARDGLAIEAYLLLPPGKSAKDGPFPLLLFPHGGPLARDDARFDWWAAYFAQRGYAVLKPNFRGSYGYGRAFRDKGRNELGGAMIDDIIDGAKDLISRGVADKDRICAMGARFGGYAALMIPVRDAALLRCVIAVNPVTDPSGYISEVVKATGTRSLELDFWSDYMGDRFRDAADKIAISPLRSAAAIKVPVLLQSTLDSTVLIGQSRALKSRLDKLGTPAQLVEFGGDDRTLNSAAARRTLLTGIDAFLQASLRQD
ncbi:MAG: hypothetical protein CMLOHMNK_00113 [Steroidobacteraceae bacterium]|nr:hypothetical protein [Steroidobacteraceae bacterium]